jgi:hypothetical protein
MQQSYADERYEDDKGEDAVPTHWLTDIGEQNRVPSPYIGSDGLVDYMYGTFLNIVSAVGVASRCQVKGRKEHTDKLS